MRNTRFGLAVLAVWGLGCGHLVQFDVQQALGEQTIQGSPLGGLLPSFLPNPFTLTVNVQQETAARNTGPASAVYLKALTFSATKNSGTFDFLDEVHIFISAPGQPKVEVASATSIAKGLTTLTLTVVPSVDLLPSVNAGATLSATATGRQPAKDFSFDGLVVLDIRI